MPSIRYHFASSPELEKFIEFDTDSLSVGDLKVAIARNEDLGRAKYDFKVINASSRSKEPYKSDLTMVPANSILTIKRVPAQRVVIETTEQTLTSSGAPLLMATGDFDDDASAISRIAMAEAARYSDRKALEMARSRNERTDRPVIIKEEIGNDIPTYKDTDPLPHLIDPIPDMEAFRHGPLWKMDLKQIQAQSQAPQSRKTHHTKANRRGPKPKRRRDI